MKILFIGQGKSYVDERSIAEMADTCRSLYRDAIIERLDDEGRDSIALLQAYDIMQTPAVLITQDDGKLLGMWQHRLPTMEEISHVMSARL